MPQVVLHLDVPELLPRMVEADGLALELLCEVSRVLGIPHMPPPRGGSLIKLSNQYNHSIPASCGHGYQLHAICLSLRQAAQGALHPIRINTGYRRVAKWLS